MKLDIYVCENFAPDYEEVIKAENFEDVTVVKYPCLCASRNMLKKSFELFQEEQQPQLDKFIICGSQCKILNLDNIESLTYKINKSRYCFNYLTNEKLIEYIIEKGGYIVTAGWLKNWQDRLTLDGFDRVTARKFYSEFCKELVLLDTQIDSKSIKMMEEFSNYLEIPFTILNIGLDNLKVYLRSIVFEWRLNRKKEEYSNSLQDIRRQTSEYSAVLSIIEQIAGYTKKRDIVDKLKEIFQTIFGAQRVRYIDKIGNSEYFENCYNDFISNSTIEHLISTEKNEIVIKIEHNSELFGVLEAGDFLFPKYLKNYTNFAISIARVSALAFSNSKQFELLEKSKEEVTFTSYHDSLTGLYNRNYYNKYISEQSIPDSTIAFMCDVDNLKKVNDNLGHIYGDELICMAAQVLEECFRKTDIIARIGGDEFCVIVSNSNIDLAEMTKKRIQEAINRKNEENEDKPFRLSLSVGYTIADGVNKDWDQIINEADHRMYEEKALKKMQKQN